MVAEEGQPDDNNGLLVISRRVREWWVMGTLKNMWLQDEMVSRKKITYCINENGVVKSKLIRTNNNFDLRVHETMACLLAHSRYNNNFNRWLCRTSHEMKQWGRNFSIYFVDFPSFNFIFSWCLSGLFSLLFLKSLQSQLAYTQLTIGG